MIYITPKHSLKLLLLIRSRLNIFSIHQPPFRTLVHNLNDPNVSYEFGRVSDSSVSCSPLTIGKLLKRSCESNPDNVAFIIPHQDIQKTYREFYLDVNKLASALYSIGCRRGSIVGLWAVNCYEWLLTQFATGILGSIMVAINPGYKEHEISTSMKLVEIETLIMNQKFKTSNYYQIMDNISPGLFSNAKDHQVYSKELPKLKNLIVIDQPQEEIVPSNVCRFSTLMNKKIDNNLEFSKNQTDFDDVINVQFTSGTTGTPKSSMATHYNIIQNAQFVSSIFFEGLGLSSDQEEKPIICLPNPLYHTFGCVLGSMASIYVNGTLVLSGPVFNIQQTLSSIERFKCNFLYGTPTMWSDLLYGQIDKFDLNTLKRGVMSGAPCPPSLLEYAFQSVPSLKHILIPYGATEVGPVATCTRIHDSRKHQLETVGRPIPLVEIKVIHLETGRILSRGEKGEICIRSHGTFPGYMNQPDKTKEVIDSNFWYHTGDVGFMDHNGYLRINGRIKDMIIRGGENIYPREVEELMQEMNKSIEDVHIVGIPDERLGEEMVAYVKLKKQAPKILEEELKDFLKTKISHFKVPKYIRFVDDFPRTSTGKVQKGELKKLAAEQFDKNK